MEQTIVLRNLTIGYATKTGRKVVAEGLEAAVNSGELTCLLGRNGIGKSTLLRTLACFQQPLEGDILIATDNGGTLAPLHGLSEQQRSRQIGVVLTEKPTVRNMTAWEMVAMGRMPYTGFWGTLDEEDRRQVDEAISLVGIGTLSRHAIDTLSDGERQKVMIAKALAQQTPVILLDEPTAFLDYGSKVEVLLLLRRLASEQQKTILLSTHDVELALQLADRLWLMETGTLTMGTPRQLADNGALARFIERPGIAFEQHSLTIHVSKI